MKLYRAISDAFNIDPQLILGKGMYSIVSQYTGDSVSKITIDPSYNSFINMPREGQKSSPTFITGHYEQCGYIYVNGHEFMANQYILPKLYPILITKLSYSKRKQVHAWKKFTNHFNTRLLDVRKYQNDLIQLKNLYFKDWDEGFHINLENIIRGLSHKEIFDSFNKANIMQDALGNLVITDPVMCVATATKLRSMTPLPF